MYLTGRDENGNPNVAQPRNPAVAVFQGFKVESRKALMEMAQKEADGRASRGRSSARALTQFLGPIETVKEPATDMPAEREPLDEPKAPMPSSFVPVEVEGDEDDDGEAGTDEDESVEVAEESADDGDEDDEDEDEDDGEEKKTVAKKTTKKRTTRRRTKKSS